jgi:glycosyltransferase involved in cell wall biosynthesis
MMKRLRVGFLSAQNYFDKTSWSGILYSMHQALMSTDLEIINLGYPSQPSRWRGLWNRFVNRLSKNKPPAKQGSQRYIAECKKFASGVQKQLLKAPCDVIFAPVVDTELNFVETDIPIVKLSDATFPLIRQGYNLNLDQQEIDWILKDEALAISRATKLVYPSQWAANSAISQYQVDPAKIAIIPFGANIEQPPSASEVLSPRATTPCRLLFVGRDWQRKGGNIAFETFISLLQRGVDAELIVLGSVPREQFKHDKLTVIPYLNKKVPDERQQIYNLFLKAHFFIFPTRADCSPIVISEASAFGLPVITTDVGGIPTIIKNGKNGYMLPLSASSDDYANLIVENFSDRTRYENLVRSSREEYERRLNWNKWAEDMEQVFAIAFDESAASQHTERAVI